MGEKENALNLNSLEKIMVEHGLSIRAVPLTRRIVVEMRHQKEFPNGHAEYLDEFHRETWVEVRKIPCGGQFVVEKNCGTHATIRFSGEKFYDSLEELVEDIENLQLKSRVSDDRNL